MSPKIERVTESIGLGEGPHWDSSTQSLYFVEIMKQCIVKYDPATRKVTKASAAPKQASFIIPIQGKNQQFIISLNKELVIVSWDGESDTFAIVENLGVAEDTPETSNHKLNDAKCDSLGRLWTGTFNINSKDIYKTQPVGTMYSFDSNHQLKKHVNQLRLTNGFAFNDQKKKMFHIDSLKYSVDQYDFDVENGTIINRQVWFSFKKNNIPGLPDGMTIDTDGNLWIAMICGGRVVKIDGHKPETLLESIELPAEEPTSVTFGGRNLDELYVTTACLERTGAPPKPPNNGAIFKITETGSKGFPANNFKFN